MTAMLDFHKVCLHLSLHTMMPDLHSVGACVQSGHHDEDIKNRDLFRMNDRTYRPPPAVWKLADLRKLVKLGHGVLRGSCGRRVESWRALRPS